MGAARAFFGNDSYAFMRDIGVFVFPQRIIYKGEPRKNDVRIKCNCTSITKTLHSFQLSDRLTLAPMTVVLLLAAVGGYWRRRKSRSTVAQTPYVIMVVIEYRRICVSYFQII